MSSSGSRGPPGNRYGERSEYNDYNKARRKNYYSSSRRDFKGNVSQAPGGSPHFKSTSNEENQQSSGEQRYSSLSRAKYNNGSLPGSGSLSRTSYNPHSSTRDNRNAYGSYNANKSSYPPYTGNSSSNGFYSSYNNYNGFNGNKRSISDYSKNGASSFYGGRNDVRRDKIKPGGDSRLSSSNKSGSFASAYNPRAGSSIPPGSAGDFRKERYDSYGAPESQINMGQNGKWRSYSGNNRFSSNGNQAGRPSSLKDKSRNFYGGSSALVNSGRRNDSYYPERHTNSLTNSTQYQKAYCTDSSISKSNDESAGFKGSDDEGEDEEDEDYDKDLIDFKQKDHDEHDFTVDDDGDTTYSHVEQNEDDFAHKIVSDKESDAEVNHEMKEVSSIESQNKSDNEDERDEERNSSTVENASGFPINDDRDDFSKENILDGLEKKPDDSIEYPKTMDLSEEICYPEGCIYPLTRLETRFRNIEREFNIKTKDERRSSDQAPNGKQVKDFSDYSFTIENLRYFSATKDVLKAILIDRALNTRRKRLSLWHDYTEKSKTWAEERKLMDKQLKILHPPDDEMRKEIDASDLKKHQQSSDISTSEVSLPPPTAVNNRRGRRHGDLVTTEAEFQEILQTLGKEDIEDPLLRAERVAATIPDLILDPIQRNEVRFMDSNNIVVDKQQWSQRVKSDFSDNFSSVEHSLFCEAFCLYPKRFGAISRHMGGLRKAGECVIHYYVTKKSVNYKHILAQYRKKMSKKAGRKGKTIRARNTSQTQSPVITPTMEQEPIFDELVPSDGQNETIINSAQSDHYNEEVYSETGRRKRAAAPSFEGSVKKQDTKPERPELEISIPFKKKPKKKKEESNISQPVNETDPGTPLTSSKDGNLEVDSEISQDSDVKDKRKGISSYWSITEANSFPILLAEHGTKWTTIADKLSTKTATMVRNYFQRNAEKNNWSRLAESADARLEAKFAAVVGRPEGETEKIDPPVFPPMAGSTSSNVPVMGQFGNGAPLQKSNAGAAPPESISPSEKIPSYNPVNVVKQEETLPSLISHGAPTAVFSQIPLPPSGIAVGATVVDNRTSPTPTTMHRESKKASIMSMLNSDTTNIEDTQGTKEPQFQRNSLGDLLNTPSSPSGSQPVKQT